MQGCRDALSETEVIMKNQVKKWLEEGTVDIFLGYRHVYGHPVPHCFVRERPEEVDQLVDSPVRYSLEKLASHIASRKPGVTIGILSRDCNQRALKVLTAWNVLQPDDIKTITVNCCPSDLKPHADCSYLEPPPVGAVKQQIGIDNRLDPDTVAAYPENERLQRWMYEFQKCLKCYGCRNICPVCFCKECSLNHEELIGTGRLPPEVPLFHLVRAVHMAGRCIDCGLCEEACPVDIPLRLLYRKVNALCSDLFDYQPGISDGPSPFNVIGSDPPLTPKPMHAEDASASGQGRPPGESEPAQRALP